MSTAKRQSQTKLVGLESQSSASPTESPYGNDAGVSDDQRLSRPEKEDGEDHYVDPMPAATMAPSSSSVVSARISSPGSPTGYSDADHVSASPSLTRHSHKPPLSPACTTKSSQMHSPASSSIFERDVQENILPTQVSPSIPSHFRTENHIPPVLEASSAAIADQLDPDSVEIITHSVHQPAAAGLTTEQPFSTGPEEVGWPTGSSQEFPYGTSDPTDIRRLSFVSFADVVNAESAEINEPFPNRDTPQAAACSDNFVPKTSQERLPSPLHSPTSSHDFGTSPPTSISTSLKGLEISPNHRGHGPGSPLSTAQSPLSSKFASNTGGELNVEKMGQALRRTDSGDLSSVKSPVSSTLGNDDILDCSISYLPHAR